MPPPVEIGLTDLPKTGGAYAHWDLLKILVWKFKYGNQLVFNKSGNQLVLVYM